MPPYDLDFQTRITDPSDPLGTTSVRVMANVYELGDGVHNFTYRLSVQVYGIFRTADDSEVDFKSLSGDDQNRIENECEQEYRKQIN